MSGGRRYRSKDVASSLIGLSISYQRDPLFARGYGLEHLRELLVRIARPCLRQGANLAYGGHWKTDSPDDGNFTYDLLRLISAEQEDSTLGESSTSLPIGRLYNHSAWPHYLEITPQIEAEWINCCRIVRVTQKDAGLAEADIVPDAEAASGTNRAKFNAAVTLSAMRRWMSAGTSIAIPDVPSPEFIPPISARVLLLGKAEGYSGFVPGLFEEALLAMEKGCPLYIAGGFGGAAEVLAKALVGVDRPMELTADWQKARNPVVAMLAEPSTQFALPAGARSTVEVLDTLYERIVMARGALGAKLHAGLSDRDTSELLTTRDMSRVVQLVREGLRSAGLRNLPS